MNQSLTYRDDALLDLGSVIALYQRTSLGARRPVDRPDVFQSMLDNANLIITAWHGNQLVGIARTMTDFSYAAYLSDLAVDEAYQKQGIGKQLIDETRKRLWPECMLILLAAPAANEYYPKLGFQNHPRAWTIGGRKKPTAG